MQGGLHPKLKLDWYEDLLRWIKANYRIHIHGFSPPELDWFAKINRMSLQEMLIRLRDAGLDSIPGGGAEILTDHARNEISPKKCTADEWLEVMRQGHLVGLKSSATMMYGHVESYAERVEHLVRLRDLQDETGGFTAFICWSLQPDNTRMDHIPPAGSFEYLKTLAISRLFLDNFDNFQSSWVTQGPKIGQLSLKFGANDMGGTMIEENVVSKAGTVYCMPIEEIERTIAELGYIPKTPQFFLRTPELTIIRMDPEFTRLFACGEPIQICFPFLCLNESLTMPCFLSRVHLERFNVRFFPLNELDNIDRIAPFEGTPNLINLHLKCGEHRFSRTSHTGNIIAVWAEREQVAFLDRTVGLLLNSSGASYFSNKASSDVVSARLLSRFCASSKARSLDFSVFRSLRTCGLISENAGIVAGFFSRTVATK